MYIVWLYMNTLSVLPKVHGGPLCFRVCFQMHTLLRSNFCALLLPNGTSCFWSGTSSIDPRHIAQTVVDSLITAVLVCLLNQSRGHQLLSDVLNRTITITLKFQEEIINHVIPNNMVDDDTGRCMQNWMSWLSTSIDGLFLAWILFFLFY